MTDTPYPHLFTPLRVGARTLRNRICLPATVTNFAAANMITERWTQFLVERARGGAAMVVTEVVAVDPEAVAQATTVIGFDDRNNAGFTATSAAIEDAGGLMVAQLWHPGRQQLWHPTKSPAGVSDGPDPYSWTVAHVMDNDEIHDLITKFAATAARLQGCGLAGVELHGAHGYLINQFLSPWSNRREDDWGGDLDGRSRFVREIVAAIRAACGPDFILGLKMPGTESVDGGIDPDEAARITSHLAALGSIDYFAYGQGNFSLSLENHVPDMYFQPGHFLDIHKQMRTAAKGTPVMALGRIGDPALAERAIAEGQGDLIGMSRAQISDAAFANKAHRGAAADIRPCVFDNSSWGEIHQGKPLAEFHNPMLGLAGEADWSPPAAQNPKRVAVIGAGPAAWKRPGWRPRAATRCAVRRRHRNRRGATPGGALARAGRHGPHHRPSRTPGRTSSGRPPSGATRQRRGFARLRRRGGDLGDRRRAAATELDAAADAPLISGRDYMASGGLASGLGGGTVMLIDQDQTAATYGLADQLAQDFEKLIIVTPRPHFAQAVNYCSAIGVYRRLYQANVELVPAMRATAFRDGEVTLENAYGGPGRQLGGIDAVVYVTPRRVVASDIAAAAEGPWTLQRVGDCRSPRNLMAAIHGGHHAAMAL